MNAETGTAATVSSWEFNTFFGYYTINFKPALDVQGKYNVTFPAGSMGTEEITFSFWLGPEQTEPEPAGAYEVAIAYYINDGKKTPAQFEALTSFNLSGIAITVNGVKPTNGTQDIFTVKYPDGTVKKGDWYNPNSPWGGFQLMFISNLTAKGKYTITIPAGAIAVNGVNTTEPIVFDVVLGSAEEPEPQPVEPTYTTNLTENQVFTESSIQFKLTVTCPGAAYVGRDLQDMIDVLTEDGQHVAYGTTSRTNGQSPFSITISDLESGTYKLQLRANALMNGTTYETFPATPVDLGTIKVELPQPAIVPTLTAGTQTNIAKIEFDQATATYSVYLYELESADALLQTGKPGSASGNIYMSLELPNSTDAFGTVTLSKVQYIFAEGEYNANSRYVAKSNNIIRVLTGTLTPNSTTFTSSAPIVMGSPLTIAFNEDAITATDADGAALEIAPFTIKIYYTIKPTVTITSSANLQDGETESEIAAAPWIDKEYNELNPTDDNSVIWVATDMTEGADKLDVTVEISTVGNREALKEWAMDALRYESSYKCSWYDDHYLFYVPTAVTLYTGESVTFTITVKNGSRVLETKTITIDGDATPMSQYSYSVLDVPAEVIQADATTLVVKSSVALGSLEASSPQIVDSKDSNDPKVLHEAVNYTVTKDSATQWTINLQPEYTQAAGFGMTILIKATDSTGLLLSGGNQGEAGNLYDFEIYNPALFLTLTCTPEGGEVESLDTFKVWVPDQDTSRDWNKPNPQLLAQNGSVVYEFANTEQFVSGEKPVTYPGQEETTEPIYGLLLPLPAEVAEQLADEGGEYTLYVPEGSLVIGTYPDETSNKELRVVYTLPTSPYSKEIAYEDITFTPSANEEVPADLTYIVVSTSNGAAIGNIEAYSGETLEGEPLTVEQIDENTWYVYVTPVAPDFGVAMQVYDANGKPVYGNDSMADGTQYIHVNYSMFDVESCIEFTVSPANGEFVKVLTEFVISCGETGAALNYGNPNMNVERPMLKDQYEYEYVFTEADYKLLEDEPVGYDEDGAPMYNCALVLPQEVNAPGVYTLTIPMRYFLTGAGYEVYTNKAITAVYTIEHSGIESILGEGVNTVTVYGINGMKVLDNAPAAELKKLDAGYYVVNGQKIKIRK